MPRLCQSDYRYSDYLASPSSLRLQASGRPLLTPAQFDERMIPWNINHFHPILAQLADGVRFLHLKICNFGPAGTMDLKAIRFQHRGYTSRETVSSTLLGLLDFLDEHPKEIVILGFNNLHNSGSKSFTEADIAALANALETAIGTERLISQHHFQQKIGDLVESDRRVAATWQRDRAAEHSLKAPSKVLLHMH